MSRALARDKRLPRDAYLTPDPVAQACLLSVAPGVGLTARKPTTVIEPSVGGGAFARAARSVWGTPQIWGVDTNPAAAGFQDCDHVIVGDWLDVKFPDWRPDAIVGNPPYRDAQTHIEHALATGAPFVGFLLRLAFLEGQARAPFWRAHRPTAVRVLCRRPSFTRGGTDAAAYAWFVWQDCTIAYPGHHGATLGWIWP